MVITWAYYMRLFQFDQYGGKLITAALRASKAEATTQFAGVDLLGHLL
jgi:hypothetical protein